MLKLNKVVISVKEGEQEVLFAVYRRYRNDFVEWARSNYSCSDELAKNILKQVLQAFYTNINSGRVIQLAEDLKSYLFHHGKIKLINILRPKHATVAIGSQEEDAHPLKQAAIGLHKDFSDFQQPYEEFDENLKKVLRLFYIQNMSAREVTKIMGLKNAEACRMERRAALQFFQQQVLKSPETTVNNFEEINNYLLGNMVAGEKALFQARLLIDPQLAAEVESLQRAIETFIVLDQNALLRGFSTIDHHLDSQPKTSVPQAKRLSVVLAAAAIVSVSVFFFIFQNSESRISAFEEQEIGLPVVMGQSDVVFDNAMSHYKMGEYRKSLELLNQITSGKGADTLSYYRGINDYMLGNYLGAIEYFKGVPGNSAFYQKATYRMGLAYWHADELLNARKVFATLADSDSPYQKRAEQILLELGE